MTPQVGDIWEWTDLGNSKSYWLLVKERNTRWSDSKFFRGICLTTGRITELEIALEQTRWTKLS